MMLNYHDSAVAPVEWVSQCIGAKWDELGFTAGDRLNTLEEISVVDENVKIMIQRRDMPAIAARFCG